MGKGERRRRVLRGERKGEFEQLSLAPGILFLFLFIFDYSLPVCVPEGYDRPIEMR